MKVDIRVEDFNSVVQNPDLMAKLRELTLNHYSGLNYELTNLTKLAQFRPVNCQILKTYIENKLIGWALLSRESSDFCFINTCGPFDANDGVLFEVYIHPDYRRQGIATELIKVARRKANPYKLCICPHDWLSSRFFDNFKNYGAKIL